MRYNPTCREKKRYILFEIIAKEKLLKAEIKNSIYNNCLNFLGEEKFSKANIELVNNNILKINNNYKTEIIVVLSLIRKINNKKVMINTQKTSGILKKLKKR